MAGRVNRVGLENRREVLLINSVKHKKNGKLRKWESKYGKCISGMRTASVVRFTVAYVNIVAKYTFRNWNYEKYEMKYMRPAAGYTWTDNTTNTEIVKGINVSPVLDILRE